ncbi:hypothetical protein [Bremerella alba]|uniref:Uncharacterized protein n=1 Tax=Bremerella alba TaxID=980252 RepID=A0A7V8V680_9BACT|nr:hypothetical protein [Bremerella alba]MBA2115709.1 hypothetical protein [Bremerella alba]
MNPEKNMWLDLFERWPKDMPQKGVIMSELNESIPFVGFALDENMVVVQRQTPDAIGARQAIIPFNSISYLKITAIVPPKAYTEFGFKGALPKV